MEAVADCDFGRPKSVVVDFGRDSKVVVGAPCVAVLLAKLVNWVVVGEVREGLW